MTVGFLSLNATTLQVSPLCRTTLGFRSTESTSLDKRDFSPSYFFLSHFPVGRDGTRESSLCLVEPGLQKGFEPRPQFSTLWKKTVDTAKGQKDSTHVKDRTTYTDATRRFVYRYLPTETKITCTCRIVLIVLPWSLKKCCLLRYISQLFSDSNSTMTHIYNMVTSYSSVSLERLEVLGSLLEEPMTRKMLKRRNTKWIKWQKILLFYLSYDSSPCSVLFPYNTNKKI